jgi:hypothetical protein
MKAVREDLLHLPFFLVVHDDQLGIRYGGARAPSVLLQQGDMKNRVNASIGLGELQQVSLLTNNIFNLERTFIFLV